MKRRKLITSDEATPAGGQLKGPCSDCPWARDAVPGWLGPLDADAWLDVAHADGAVPCHAHTDTQCAGIAIFRANVCKSPRDPEVVRLPADRKRVFASNTEFKNHHEE